MADTKKKTPLNCRNFTAWAMTDEDEETYSQAPVSLAGKTMNFTDSLTVNTTDLSGDGVIADTATGVGKGQLTVGIHDLTDSERVTFFGETLQNGAVVTTGRESSPALCVALVTDCATDGSVVNLYKWFAVRFKPNEVNVQQIDNGNVTFSTTSIQGDYTRNSRLGMMRAKRSHVDTTTVEGAALVQSWLTQADYIGP